MSKFSPDRYILYPAPKPEVGRVELSTAALRVVNPSKLEELSAFRSDLKAALDDSGVLEAVQDLANACDNNLCGARTSSMRELADTCAEFCGGAAPIPADELTPALVSQLGRGRLAGYLLLENAMAELVGSAARVDDFRVRKMAQPAEITGAVQTIIVLAKKGLIESTIRFVKTWNEFEQLSLDSAPSANGKKVAKLEPELEEIAQQILAAINETLKVVPFTRDNAIKEHQVRLEEILRFSALRESIPLKGIQQVLEDRLSKEERYLKSEERCSGIPPQQQNPSDAVNYDRQAYYDTQWALRHALTRLLSGLH